ncbi:transcriptional regulator [Mycobacterium intermedium]|uniref:Transcriptional regulator n=1 Tax=Mycobacterium intermedium TaxID=28445 RepID=A0A1E3S7I2_MYCIE|nr:Lrp/AsnC family transcriptional regulator [Mycobacterium intermedium]MCV6963599.1 Lrp/AsnC family transcriptional regulator [Mycobacterium intermedium]ODQ97602.1 transcriptional regulator [Mycobacterium intermedium]OPE46734.1 transcriptional regulator [Mycobacterium intermedium]ORB09608.1 transcriptional regulator [Mycobacterium intermedium]
MAEAAPSRVQLDEVDRRLIRELVKDGRISMLALAQRAHVSRTHVYARVERLERMGVIEGFTARINLEKAGFATSALIALSIQQDSWRGLSQKLKTLRYVERFVLVGGDFDVLVVVRTPDNAALRDVVLEQIHSLAGVRASRTWLMFEECDGMQSELF